MKRMFRFIGVALPLIVAASAPAWAKTLYVDQRYGSGGDGSTNKPYATIQAAINDFSATEIIVYPGTYTENLLITKNIKIYGYDGPHTTRLVGTTRQVFLPSETKVQTETIVINPGLDVWIEGLSISSGRYGLYQYQRGTLHVRNCVICGNDSHGVFIYRTEDANAPVVFVYNCVLVANGGSGLFIETWRWNNYPDVAVLNTILVSNTRYGVEINYNGGGGWGGVVGALTFDYNDYVGNILGKYTDPVGPGKPVSQGAHSIESSPEFVGGSGNVCNLDFRLTPTSSCKDTGSPGNGWLDPDGTRNDMGAYGGPGAQRFYTNPNDGPVIRTVTIDQGMVPRGGTFTIRAKGAVR